MAKIIVVTSGRQWDALRARSDVREITPDVLEHTKTGDRYVTPSQAFQYDWSGS